jgi:hypothetical protein
MRRNVLAATAVLAVGLVLGGCGSSDRPATVGTGASASAAAGTPVTDRENGFALTLPAGFRYARDAAGLERAVSGVDRKKFPDITSQLRAVFGQGGKLVAVRAVGDELDNITVSVGPAGPMTSASLAQDKIRAQLKQQIIGLGAKNVTLAPVTLDGAQGLRVDYQLPVADATVTGVQLYTVASEKTYVVTLSYRSTDKAPADHVALVERSFRVS